MNNSKIKNFLIFSVFISILISCKTETTQVIPNVPVDVIIDKNQLLSMGAGTVILKEGGFKGLMIIKISESEYKAFDRCCTNYPNDEAAVNLISNSTTAACPICKSTFQLFAEGQVLNGPAPYALQQYRAVYDGTRLRISN